MTETPRCRAAVFKRDTYRRDGRSRSGFSMHYSKCQCSRAAKAGDLCTQHDRKEKNGWWIERLDWHRTIAPTFNDTRERF